MAKPTTIDPWKAPNLSPSARAAAWLGGKGFPSEFRAATKFKSAGFSVDQGVYVEGSQGSEPLEVDVFASVGGGERTSVEVVAECKFASQANGVVWIALYGEDDPYADPLDCYPKTRVADEAMKEEAAATGLSEVQRILGDATSAIGLKVTPNISSDRQEREDRDPAYSAVTGLVARARALMPRLDDYWGLMVIPVLVIDGDLVAARWKGDGKFQIEPANRLRLRWTGVPGLEGHPSVIEVATLEGLSSMASELFAAGKAWISAVDPIVPAKIKAISDARLSKMMSDAILRTPTTSDPAYRYRW